MTFVINLIRKYFLSPNKYSEVPNIRADRNKRAGLEKSATLLAYLLSKLINEQGGIFRFLHEQDSKELSPRSLDKMLLK